MNVLISWNNTDIYEQLVSSALCTASLLADQCPSDTHALSLWGVIYCLMFAGELRTCSENPPHGEEYQLTNYGLQFSQQGATSYLCDQIFKYIQISQDGSRIVSSDKFGRIYFWRLPQYLNTATIQEKNRFQNIPYKSE